MKYLQSWTLWLNVLTLLPIILTDTDILAIIPPGWTPYLAAFLALANILLRVFKTQTPLNPVITTPPTN